MKEKTLGNTTASQAKDNIPDLVIWGNGDSFKLLFKASSQKEGWMKSTKAMEIPHCGCFVQVTTQQKNEDGSYVVAESLTFAEGMQIRDDFDEEGLVVIGRHLELIHTGR